MSWPGRLDALNATQGMVRAWLGKQRARGEVRAWPAASLLKNLPFSVDNRWRLLAVMCAFFGSGFAAPFFIVRHQLLKK